MACWLSVLSADADLVGLRGVLAAAGQRSNEASKICVALKPYTERTRESTVHAQVDSSRVTLQQRRDLVSLLLQEGKCSAAISGRSSCDNLGFGMSRCCLANRTVTGWGGDCDLFSTRKIYMAFKQVHIAFCPAGWV